MSSIIEQITQEAVKKEAPAFRPGDTVKVHTKVKEGDRERVQIYEGVVIKSTGKCGNATFTVRKISFGVGVERIFPVHSPMIEKIEVIRKGKVRRSRLFHLRELRGKKARIKEKRSQ